jgi:hypothetical protein
MTDRNARLFGAGSPATGELARIAIGEHELEVHTDATVHRAPLKTLRIREVNAGASGLELAWNAPEGVHAVHTFEAETLQTLRTHPSLSVSPQMAAVRANRQGPLGSRKESDAIGRRPARCDSIRPPKARGSVRICRSAVREHRHEAERAQPASSRTTSITTSGRSFWM